MLSSDVKRLEEAVQQNAEWGRMSQQGLNEKRVYVDPTTPGEAVISTTWSGPKEAQEFERRYDTAMSSLQDDALTSEVVDRPTLLVTPAAASADTQ